MSSINPHDTTRQTLSSYYTSFSKYPIAIHPFSPPPFIGAASLDQLNLANTLALLTPSFPDASHPDAPNYTLLTSLRSQLLDQTHWHDAFAKCWAVVNHYTEIYDINVTMQQNASGAPDKMILSTERCYMKILKGDANVKMEDSMRDREIEHNSQRLTFLYYNGTSQAEFNAVDFSDEYHERFVTNLDLVFKKWVILRNYEQIATKMEQIMREKLAEMRQFVSVQHGNFGNVHKDLMNMTLTPDEVLTGCGVVRELSDALYINFYMLRDGFMSRVYAADAEVRALPTHHNEHHSTTNEDGTSTTPNHMSPHDSSTNVPATPHVDSDTRSARRQSFESNIFPYFRHPKTNFSTRHSYCALLTLCENAPFIRTNIRPDLQVPHPLVYMLQLDRPMVVPYAHAQQILSLIFKMKYPKVQPTDYPSFEELLLANFPKFTKNSVRCTMRVGDIKYCYNATLNEHDAHTIPTIEITHVYFLDPATLPDILQLLRMQLYENELFSKFFAFPQTQEDVQEQQQVVSGDDDTPLRNVQVRVLKHHTISISTSVNTAEGSKPCNIRVYLEKNLDCKVAIMVGNNQDESLQEEAARLINTHHNLPLLIHFIVKKYEQ